MILLSILFALRDKLLPLKNDLEKKAVLLEKKIREARVSFHKQQQLFDCLSIIKPYNDFLMNNDFLIKGVFNYSFYDFFLSIS